MYQTDFLYVPDYILWLQITKKEFQSSIVIIQSRHCHFGSPAWVYRDFLKGIRNIFLFHDYSVAVVEGIEIQL